MFYLIILYLGYFVILRRCSLNCLTVGLFRPILFPQMKLASLQAVIEFE